MEERGPPLLPHPHQSNPTHRDQVVPGQQQQQGLDAAWEEVAGPEEGLQGRMHDVPQGVGLEGEWEAAAAVGLCVGGGVVFGGGLVEWVVEAWVLFSVGRVGLVWFGLWSHLCLSALDDASPLLHLFLTFKPPSFWMKK
jgi:hypothetical protein